MNLLLNKTNRSIKPFTYIVSRCYASSSSSPVKLVFDSYQDKHVTEPGPPLIIIHGLFGSKRNWGALAKALSKHGRRIIAVDGRNHGASPHTDVMDYHSMSADIVELMKNEGLEKAHILGHSMGGKVAMTLAFTQPSLIEKLIIEDILPCVSPAAVTQFPAYAKAMMDVDFSRLTDGTLAEARQDIDQQLKKVFQEAAVRAFILTNVEKKEEGGYGWNVNVKAISENIENVFGFPDFDNVTYDKETLFVGGSYSEHFREDKHGLIHQFFPSAKIRLIKDAGHWVHAEQPHAFLEVVNQFLDGKKT